MPRPLLLLSVLYFLVANHLTAQAQNDLERLKVTKEISMLVPAQFLPMTQSDLVNKYVSYRMPIAMFTSADRRIDLGVNQNSSPWSSGDLNILKDFYKAGILNLFTEVTFIRDEIRDIGGRSFVVFEFVSRVSDEDQSFGGLSNPVSNYTYIMYTLHNQRVLLFNFTSPISYRSQWQEAAHQIMESVRIK